MRKLGVLLVVLLLGISMAYAQEVPFYKEEFVFTIKVLDNGDAQITLRTSWLEPKDEIQKQIEQILNQTNLTKEEAIKKYEQEQLERYITSLANYGIKTTNQSLKILGLDKDNNLTVVFTAVAEKFAKYYSYDGYWEIIVDPTRGYGTAPIPDTGLPYEIELHNIFIIELPQDAKLLEYPKPITREYNQSKFYVRSKVEGNKIIVTSDIYLEPYLRPEGFKALFGDYNTFYVRYTTPQPGEEEQYQKVVSEQYLRAEILPNGTTNLFIKDTYIEPKDQVQLMKLQINLMGVQNVTDLLLQNNIQALGAQGVKINKANLQILGLNGTGPLVIEANYVVQNFTKIVNGTHEYSFDPTLGYTLYDIGYRAQNEINQTLKLEFILPKDAKIVEVPQNITRELKGNKFTLTTLIDGNKISVTANVFIRYGAPQEDVQKLLANVSRAYIRFTLPETSQGLNYKQIGAAIGALVLIGLAVFLIRRR
ncbi:MAG: exodeoxyribonuclease VII small subunit [Thermococcus sp.]|uniref:exodeoxyribonuclease VII small subunit n=1 Tax=Thermococcus sp. TaxID=35749 RepID=UPI001D2BFDC9|nr:exodeoxyribonuclease VII small subunit [Thermococcus sp.]MBO8173657.1 exodeoxyribonuclease VII small subunit [Thermococcus sp.]